MTTHKRLRHFFTAFRFATQDDDLMRHRLRESDLRRQLRDKVQRNKCDKPKRDSVVAASRRYLKVNVLWRTAATFRSDKPPYIYYILFSDYRHYGHVCRCPSLPVAASRCILLFPSSFLPFRRMFLRLCLVEISMPKTWFLIRADLSLFCILAESLAPTRLFRTMESAFLLLLLKGIDLRNLGWFMFLRQICRCRHKILSFRKRGFRQILCGAYINTKLAMIKHKTSYLESR